MTCEVRTESAPDLDAALVSDIMTRVSDLSHKVGVWPSKFEVIDQDGIFRLLHYEPVVPRKYRTPLLIVCAFINRPYVLDLHADISVVGQYLKAGFDVYMIDWGYPTAADRFLDLDDYFDYIDRSVCAVKKRTDVDRLNFHGYCLGGTLAAAYTAWRQHNVRNLMVQAAPIDFNTNNTVNIWARNLDPDKLTATFGSAPGSFLNLGFLLVNPVNLVLGKYEGLIEMRESERVMTDFLRMDNWIFDSPSIPGGTYRQYIKQWYQQNALIKGEFHVLGERVDLSSIQVPLLVLAAKFDHIVPPESQKAILDVVASRDKDVYEVAKGHVGITTSRDCHREYWPKVVKWLEERSEKLIDDARSAAGAPGRGIHAARTSVPRSEGGGDAIRNRRERPAVRV